MRFLIRWAVRIALVLVLAGVYASTPVAAGILSWFLFGYLIWKAHRPIWEDLHRLGRLTSFRSIPSSRSFRLGRLKGDTL